MEKINRSSRNKTLTVSKKEYNLYKKNLCVVEKPVSENDIKNKTISGNFFDVAKYIPHSFADLLIADPPYNLTKNFNGNIFNEKNEDEYTEYTDKWLSAAIPLLKKTASVYICCDYKSSAAIYSVLKKYAVVRNRITWQREKGRGAKKNWKNSMEDIWFATIGDDYFFDIESVKMKRRVIAPYKLNGVPKDWCETDEGKFRLTYPSNFWDDISVPYWSMSENTDHPTQKPEKLIAKLILASSEKGDVVFDPFLGSGTTSVVAKKLERQFCGIEMDEEYAVWTQKRLCDAEINKRIQGYDGVFWERNSGV